MALTDEVQGRVATQLLVELTNHGDTAATTINTTRLNYACADAEALFLERVGITFDATVIKHVWPAVLAVLYVLHTYPGGDGARLDGARKRWEEAGDALAQTAGERRMPTYETSSRYDPSREAMNERPASDRERWGNYVIGQGGGVNPFEQED